VVGIKLDRVMPAFFGHQKSRRGQRLLFPCGADRAIFSYRRIAIATAAQLLVKETGNDAGYSDKPEGP